MPAKIEGLTLYDVEEIAELFRVRAGTIRTLLAKGDLKGRKLARRWFVSDAELRRYFGEGEGEQEPPASHR